MPNQIQMEINTTNSNLQYPNFIKLLSKIEHNLSEDLCSNSVKSNYESSISVLNQEKKNFLNKRKLINLARRLSISGSEEKHKCATEAIAIIKLGEIINVNHNGKIIPLAGVASGDLTYSKTNIQGILIPAIESELRRFKQTITEFCTDGIPHRSVSTIILHNNHNREKIVNIEKEVQKKTLEYVQMAGKTLTLYKRVTNHRTTDEEKDKLLTRIQHLSITSTKLNLMVDNLEAKIYSDIYSADNVSALKIIHHHLKQKEVQLEKEQSKLKHKLDAYLSLGEEFNKLVEVYKDLKSNLETYIWAADNIDRQPRS